MLLLLGIALNFSIFYPYFAALFHPVTIPAATARGIVLAADQAYTPTPALLRTSKSINTLTPTATQESRIEVTVSPTVVVTNAPPVPPPATSVATPPVSAVPVYLRIPAINLEAPIISIEWELQEMEGVSQAVWLVPDWRAVGWHFTSLPLGMAGNTVFNGHNTTRGEVFRDLHLVQPGALILVDGDNMQTYAYKVAERYLLPEAGESLEVRLENARYIQPTADERLTLVTCHPYGSTRFRLVVIARPAPQGELSPIRGE